jgi:hypothetical protein
MRKDKVDATGSLANMGKRARGSASGYNKAKQDMLQKLIDGYNQRSQTPFQAVGEYVDPETGTSMFIWAKAPFKNQ